MKKFFLFALFFVALVWSADVDQLKVQEMDLWSKVELSLLSTQNEIDGLRSLVNRLETDSEKQMSELTLSREDYSKLQSLQESTANSYSKLSMNYNLLKAQNRRLLLVLSIGTILFCLNMAGKVIIAILKAKGIKVPYWLALWV